MRFFVISDIHSFYKETINALKKTGYGENNPGHKIILCGDAFDRGDESYQIFVWLKELKKKNKIILIRGNHEDLLLDIYKNKRIGDHDLHNRSTKTIIDIVNAVEKDRIYSQFDLFTPLILNHCLKVLEDIGFIDFLKNDFIDFFETKEYVFVHGFIPTEVDCQADVNRPFVESIKEDWRHASKKEWDEARWTNGQEKVLYDGLRLKDKTIVCGHWHTSYGHLRQSEGLKVGRRYSSKEHNDDAVFDIFKTDGLIAIDGCTAYSQKVNVFCFKE